MVLQRDAQASLIQQRRQIHAVIGLVIFLSSKYMVLQRDAQAPLVPQSRDILAVIG